MKGLEVILCLGGLSHGAVLSTLGARKSAYPFKHGALHRIDGLTVADSYHCSRDNTKTGRLTEAIFVVFLSHIRGVLATLRQDT